MSNWYVYIILTKKNKLYTGVSTDPERRFIEHLCDSKKGAKFFRSDTPVQIVYLENCENYSEALKREYVIKQYSTIKKWNLFSNKKLN
jgi:putative endonuclease